MMRRAVLMPLECCHRWLPAARTMLDAPDVTGRMHATNQQQQQQQQVYKYTLHVHPRPTFSHASRLRDT